MPGSLLLVIKSRAPTLVGKGYIYLLPLSLSIFFPLFVYAFNTNLKQNMHAISTAI